ncbi:hypothetical protein PCANC_15460 [Puccinia coronata f. sp. avenae]|uniref:COP9 signalosome complex subunit 5 n=2 Tax=Puccinia coronata f. sp. avenae TaxID=200324 RepID=A0A2N5VFA4_9BASI|nr:hypothetical protein PCANC_15460 [Puccinia coronata f. sp. avenae]
MSQQSGQELAIKRTAQNASSAPQCWDSAPRSAACQAFRFPAGYPVRKMEYSKIAQKTFELENRIQPLQQDQIFKYNAEEQKAIQKEAKWKKDPHYFKKVKISGVALIKMVMHARSGGQYEIMGLMQGKIDGDTFVVMDSFALPVQGTETRVNAANEANEYMVEFLERSKNVGRLENAVGWYHSHPGYGCWLSGIDVSTQLTNQTYTDPFVAIVIDPNRTISAGRVDIGAFRTFPEGYSPSSLGKNKDDEYQSIPLSKIEDFGAHANSYYPLEIEHFKSSSDSKILDLLWEKYWVKTLSQNTWLSNRVYTTSQIQEMTNKLTQSTTGAVAIIQKDSLPARPKVIPIIITVPCSMTS